MKKILITVSVLICLFVTSYFIGNFFTGSFDGSFQEQIIGTILGLVTWCGLFLVFMIGKMIYENI